MIKQDKRMIKKCEFSIAWARKELRQLNKEEKAKQRLTPPTE
jgi:hypothetical protein